MKTLWISVALAVLTAVSACVGLFWQPTYAQETPLWAAEGMGGDAVNLVVVVPILLVSAMLTDRRLVSPRIVWMGTLVFLLYNFAIYAMAVHFNALFLAYCGVLGFSFYALLGSLPSLSPSEIAARFGPRAPVRAMAIVFFATASVFAALWLSEIIPALLTGQVPKSITDAGLLTNPVHVLDLSFLLPAFVITGIMLLRRRPAAFILAPVLMVFTVLMTIAVAGMMVAMTLKGFANDYILAVFFFASAVGCTLLLVRYLRSAPDAHER